MPGLRGGLAALMFVQPMVWLANSVLSLTAGWSRLGARAFLDAAFVTPSGIFIPGVRGPFRIGLWTMAAGMLIALLVLFWRRPRWAKAKTIAVGAALSATLFGTTTWMREQRGQREQAQTAAVLAALPKPAPGAPFERHFFQRGVSFTAEAGVRYGSHDSIEQLKQLPAYGVNSIALVPYGGGRVTGDSVVIRSSGSGSWESDAGIEVLSAVAHQLGIKVMLKPHLWRMGPEAVPTEDLRRQWFAQYRLFIEHYARLAARTHADLFVVGTELGTLSSYESEWREIIAAVRALYAGPLTFAPAQGPEFETLAFWDALDYIGLDNYYPLPDDYSTSGLIDKIEAVHSKFGKPVVLTEAGFSAVVDAHKAPWEDETAKPLSLEEQARCYEALLQALYGKPWFQGVYWWKVGTNGYGGPGNNSMTPWRKPAMQIVKRWYSSGKR